MQVLLFRYLQEHQCLFLEALLMMRKLKPLVQKYNPSSPDHNPDFPILGLLQSDMLPSSATGGDGIAVVSGIIQMNTTFFGDVAAGTKIYVV